MTENPAALEEYLADKPHADLVREIIIARFKQNPCTVYVEMKLTSNYSVLGVEVIKQAIAGALEENKFEAGLDEKPISVTIVSPPIYRAELVTKNKK